jgi:cadmium resistance protein CadD (predicted permease)
LENIFSHIFIAISTFAVTNIDDLLLLSIYFAHPEHYTQKDIVIGQYLGVFALVAISMLGVILGEVINAEWIRFLGLIPIYLGLKDIYKHIRNRNSDNNDDIALPNGHSSVFLKVAFVTFANGGDNIGVYTPLFAVTALNYIYLYLFIFSVLIGLWCLLGKYMVSHDKVKKIFAKYGKMLLPVFLILLGLFILF